MALSHPFSYADQEFIGSLEDARGTHLFRFNVNGATETIKAMSSGYKVNVGTLGGV